MNKDDINAAIKTLEKAAKAISSGNRNICVLDRGWIFVGELSGDTANGYCLTNVKNVRKWQSGGFGLLSRGAKSAGATLDEAANLKFAASALLFHVPVDKEWENE